ncbi:hypothetical protein [Halomicronema sp. CCY15110]|uniref:hypothetical protein n=1 Tax=Halomicronema sp. CCY15110 TaxID=2767773 RepID=UPI00194DE0C1|nr:hypothetical protein [Halomicronema sp. CCY15110]
MLESPNNFVGFTPGRLASPRPAIGIRRRQGALSMDASGLLSGSWPFRWRSPHQSQANLDQVVGDQQQPIE